MTAVRSAFVANTFISVTLSVMMIAAFCYAVGRMHQYFRQGSERDLAFRDGYNTATRALFSLATRTSKSIEAGPPLETAKDRPPTLRGVAPVDGPRHRVQQGAKSTLQATKTYTAWDLAKKEKKSA